MQTPVQRRWADDGTAIVSVHGDVDVTNADEVCEGITKTVTEWSPAAVRVDLQQATFIDSTGLGALIAGYRAAVDRDTPFVVVNPSVAVRRVLAVTGLCELFGVRDQESSGTDRTASDVAM